MSKRFLTFTVIGVINTIVDISILYLLILIFGNAPVYILLLNMISYSIGIMSSFILNGVFTFNDKNLTTDKFLKLYASSIGALIINTFVVFVLIGIKTDVVISKIIAAGVVVVFNYNVCKNYIFKM